jgi:hypothetical protein
MLKASSLVFVLMVSIGAVRQCRAQDVHIPIPMAVPQSQNLRTPVPTAPVPRPATEDATVSAGDDIQRQQAIAANTQRQAEIRRDTEKMLQLTAELKDYLQNAQRGVMSIDAIKKAEQIEKLAHGVKSKLKISF